VIAELGHVAVGLEGAAHFVDMALAYSSCEVWQQDFLKSSEELFRWCIRAGTVSKKLGSVGQIELLRMQSYSKFHNESGVPIVRVGCREFKCVGAMPPQDHPAHLPQYA
jgi:hypothetical protein